MLSSQETLAQKFVKKWFWIYFFTALIWPIGYLMKVIITRDLSVEEVGMLYGVISFITFLSMYSDLGCTEALSYFLPKHIVKKEFGKAKYLVHFVIGLQITTSLIIYVLLFLLAPWLSDYYFKSPVIELLQIAWLFFIGINILHIATTFFVSVQDMKLQKWTELIRILWTTIGSWILFFWDMGNLKRYMIIWIIGLFFALIFALVIFAKKYYIPYFLHTKKERDIPLRQSFIKYALATLLLANISTLLSQIDIQMIIYFLWSKDTWYYSTYLSLIWIPFMFLSPMISFLFPVISELSWRWDEHKIQSIIEKFWMYFGIIWIWFGIFLFQFWEILSVFFFSEKFRESWRILTYSSLFIVFNILTQISFQVLVWTGRVAKRMQLLGTTLIINIALNALLIPILWTRWSALAVGLSWIPLYYMSAKATWLKLPFLGNKQSYKNILAWACAYGISYYIMKTLGSTAYFWEIILAIIVYMVIFICVNRRILLEAMMTIQTVRKEKSLPAPDTSLPL